jgi:hypothetical protein
VPYTVSFEWSPVLGASGYVLHITEDEDFAGPLLIDQTVPGPVADIALTVLRPLWWRVRAVDARGVPGQWSAVRRFEIVPPPLAVEVRAISLTPSGLPGGESASGLITLAEPAPPGGATVLLSAPVQFAGDGIAVLGARSWEEVLPGLKWEEPSVREAGAGSANDGDGKGGSARPGACRRAGRTRLLLKVQDGCAGACSYCAVRLVRGAPRSTPLEAVLAVALIAVARKIIVLDPAYLPQGTLLGIAVITFGLTLGYYLVGRRNAGGSGPGAEGRA